MKRLFVKLVCFLMRRKGPWREANEMNRYAGANFTPKEWNEHIRRGHRKRNPSLYQ